MSQTTFEDLKKMVREVESNKEEEVVDVEYVPVADEGSSGGTGENLHDAGNGVVLSGGGRDGSGGEGEEGNKELIRYSNEVSRPLTASEKLDDAIEVIDKLKRYYSKIREAAIGVTQTEDWTNWGGKYRLNESGASKIMSQLGIHEETVEQRKVNDTWGYTIYITRRYVPSWNPSASFDAVGSCRSDDAFVAVRRVYDKQLKRKVTKQLPPEEVDESNVLKAALANCRVNGVIAVCGLKTVSTEELEHAPLITVSNIEEVSFKGGKGKQKEWKPSDKQIGFAKRLGATEADITACKGHRDFQSLVDALKAGTATNNGTTEEEDF